MKEPIGKWNLIQNHFPKKMVVGNDTSLPITEYFNNYFTKIGPKLVSKIGNSTLNFDIYIYIYIKIEIYIYIYTHTHYKYELVLTQT